MLIKTKSIILLLFLAFCNLSFTPSIGNPPANYQEKNLEVLVKVWGFLKYYHPNVAEGAYNWDEQFISMISKVETINDKTELSKIYLDWINNLGAIKKCHSCNSSKKIKYFENNFDLSWLQDNNLFSQELSEKLKFIEENRFQGKHHYVDVNGRGVIEIKNETKTDDFEYPNRNFRILSLARYWNMIEYFYPYKYLIDEKWDDVLTKMIPKFIASVNSTEYQLAMLETVAKLDDTHSDFYSNEIGNFFGSKYIPYQLQAIEGNLVITSFTNDSLAKINNLNIGDIIESIDGNDAQDLLTINDKYFTGSNSSAKYRNLQYKISSGNSDSVSLQILRGSDHIEKTIGRYEWKEIKGGRKKVEKKFEILENNIGYINMAFLEEKDVKDMMESMMTTKGLIIDLRNYPKFTPINLAKYFITKERKFVEIIQPNLSYPGKFHYKKPNTITPNNKDIYKNKVILLVNNETQSRAEYSAMLLQSGDNVITIGNQTAGADGDIATIQFMGFGTYMTSLGVFYPDGSTPQRTGVKIDRNVVSSIESVNSEKDEFFDTAIEIIKKFF